MLCYTRERAADLLASAKKCVLATTGPAGVLATECGCEARGLALYVLLLQTSDHLFNLECDSRIALVTDEWELSGTGRVLSAEEKCPELELMRRPGTEWHILVRVEPTQLRVRRHEGWGSSETIDLAIAEE